MNGIGSNPRHRIVTTGCNDAELMAGVQAASLEEVWDAAAIREILAMPGTLGLLAYSADHPVGLAIVRIAADEAELLSLGVDHQYRRQGLGATLLRAACTAALAAGGVRMFLEVAAANESALGLYRSFGFTECGYRRGYYGKQSDTIDARTALVMHCDLVSTADHGEADGGIDATSR